MQPNIHRLIIQRNTSSMTSQTPDSIHTQNDALADLYYTKIESKDTNVTILSPIPDLNAPAIKTNEPAASLKIDFSDRSQWFISRDGGLTKAAYESNTVAGAPLDFSLHISRARWDDSTNSQRFRLALDQGDEIIELNINAINVSRSGEQYITSPMRSLLGGLLAISESIDDIHAWTQVARFTLVPGRGRGVFIETDLAFDGRWIAMTSAAATNRIPSDVPSMHRILRLVKGRFRGAGRLLSEAPIVGDEPPIGAGPIGAGPIGADPDGAGREGHGPAGSGPAGSGVASV